VDADHRGGWTQTFSGKSEPKTSRRVKNAILPTPPAFGTAVGMILSEVRRGLSRRKNTVPEPSLAGVSEILHLVVLVVHRLVTNGRTDGGRTHDDSKYRTSIASRG